MKQQNTYHIDVTPEEDALFRDNFKADSAKKILPYTFKKVFCLVLGVHLAIGAVILFSSSTVKASATNNKTPNFTDPIAEIPKIEEFSVPKPTPQPSPKEIVAAQTPTPKVNIQQTAKEKYTKEYIVKQGDTITSIAKKFKLNSEKLIKINNIKDVNKIRVGQKLKFL